MASKKKREEGIQFFMEMLAQQGHEVNRQDFASGEHPDRDILQAEGVLLFLESAGRSLVTKKCKECKEPFASHYKNVAYCSDRCRATRLERDYGILWDSSRDHYQMMQAERPLLVGPKAFDVLMQFAERIQAGWVQADTHRETEPEEYESDLPTSHQPSPEQLDETLDSPHQEISDFQVPSFHL